MTLTASKTTSSTTFTEARCRWLVGNMCFSMLAWLCQWVAQFNFVSFVNMAHGCRFGIRKHERAQHGLLLYLASLLGHLFLGKLVLKHLKVLVPWMFDHVVLRRFQEKTALISNTVHDPNSTILSMHLYITFNHDWRALQVLERIMEPPSAFFLALHQLLLLQGVLFFWPIVTARNRHLLWVLWNSTQWEEAVCCGRQRVPTRLQAPLCPRLRFEEDYKRNLKKYKK